MSKKNISRRDFLKMTLLGLGSAFLAACEQLLNPTPTATPAATNTNTPTSTNTPVPSETPTPTATSTPTEIPCFKLIAPENGAELPAIGKITFSWEAMPGTARYRLEIILPNSAVMPYEIEHTSLDRYAESLPMSGTYTWQVTALDAGNGIICIAGPYTFDKPVSEPGGGKEKEGGGGSGGTDDSCFLAGTMIRMADGSAKPIEDVVAGDLIKAYDEESKSIVDAKVNRVESPLRNHYCEMTLANGTILKLTEEHPLFTKKEGYEGWGALNPEATARELKTLKVQKIEIGDALLYYNGSGLEWVKVGEIQRINGTVQTYNLIDVTALDGVKKNTFFAQNLAAHNKGGEAQGGNGA